MTSWQSQILIETLPSPCLTKKRATCLDSSRIHCRIHLWEDIPTCWEDIATCRSIFSLHIPEIFQIVLMGQPNKGVININLAMIKNSCCYENWTRHLWNLKVEVSSSDCQILQSKTRLEILLFWMNLSPCNQRCTQSVENCLSLSTWIQLTKKMNACISMLPSLPHNSMNSSISKSLLILDRKQAFHKDSQWVWSCDKYLTPEK